MNLIDGAVSKMFDDIYKKNMQALQSVDVVLATKIIQASRGHSFELSVVSEKHHLYNIIDTLQERALYSEIIDELQEHLKELHPKNREPFIYLFGIGNAYTLPIILQNEKHRRIVVIEPELELLFVALHLYDLSDNIQKGRLKLFHQKSFHFAQAVELFKEHNAHHFARSYNLIVSANYYLENFSQAIEQTQSLLVDALAYDLSDIAKDFNHSLQSLDQHLQNLPDIFQHNSLQSFIQANKSGGWAIVISTMPSADELQLLQKITNYVTLIATQDILEKLYEEDIIPDIITALEFDLNLWQGLPQEIQKSIILLLPSHKKHTALQECHATIIIATIESYYNRYFDLKSFGYIKEHNLASHMAYELSYLLRYSHTLIIDTSLEDQKSQDYKHYCYLTSLYKDKMYSYHTLVEKPPFLYAKKESLSRLSDQISKEKKPKKQLLMHPDKVELTSATKARQGVKIAHLINEGYKLVQNIQQSLTLIQPWYDKLEGLSEDELSHFYNDNELSSLLDKLASITQGIEKNHIYQRFFHDFLHPSMLLLNIEQASIQSQHIVSTDDNRAKAMQWAIVNYEWLIQLQKNMPFIIELLLKHHQNEELLVS